MVGVDALQKTFKIQDGPLAMARGIGMSLFNAIPTLKKTAAEIAMGLKKQ